MNDKGQERDPLRAEDEALDRELEAALAKYAAVEPRAGLEERILANLQAERVSCSQRGWWRWSIVAAVAAIIVVSVALTYRSNKIVPPQTVQHLPSIKQKPNSPQVVAKDDHDNVRKATAPQRRSVHHAQAAIVAMATPNPKLDVFPSPQPLSEQEKLLAAYAQEEPDRAALLAEARMEALRRDAEERRALATGRDSQQ